MCAELHSADDTTISAVQSNARTWLEKGLRATVVMTPRIEGELRRVHAALDGFAAAIRQERFAESSYDSVVARTEASKAIDGLHLALAATCAVS